MNLREIHTVRDLTFATRGQEVFVRPEADNDPVEGHDTSRAATLDGQVNYLCIGSICCSVSSHPAA